ncbi:peptidoglycan DD-metalloendopeptidase family protein [Halomonas binhaiensis]|uniref:Peptidoglycan DD-metalloendopeptidase family protein n=1 Tax=Halomonas binhaiensis TaxID=2562282 RepID=A0A5C1NAU8_9GAMM|nr:peptidoglycan DD-metalloendopeptidase family protein [Halomonas binhaiensis]QEM80832.1 peptidoglycan DD-metalloendopeptidase family protein [Halomonas binhaiensis]
MHKTLAISALALAIAGCANQQASQPVQVQDLSTSKVTQANVPSQYTVVAGDTLYGIAWRHNMDFRELAQINNISPPYRISVGQTLALAPGASAGGQNQVASQGQSGAVATPLGQSSVAGNGAAPANGSSSANGSSPANGSSQDLEWLLPDGSTETSSSASQVSGAAAAGAVAAASSSEAPGPVVNYESPGANGSGKQDATAEQKAAEEAVVAAAAAEAKQTQQASSSTASTSSSQPASSSSAKKTYTPVDEVNWQWPVSGPVVSAYGESSSITAGIDIGGQKGQPVKAAGPGIVVYAGSGVRGYGNLILLKHNNEYLSAYAHNDSLNVKENDVVDAGQVIATMGDTDSEDVRLHFEIRKDGQSQDPTKYLPAQ